MTTSFIRQWNDTRIHHIVKPVVHIEVKQAKELEARLADSTNNYVIYTPHKEYKQTEVWQAVLLKDN